MSLSALTGFGRSDTREALRDFFEVDYRHIAIAALHELAREGRIDEETVSEAISEFGIDRGKPNPRGHVTRKVG